MENYGRKNAAGGAWAAREILNRCSGRRNTAPKGAKTLRKRMYIRTACGGKAPDPYAARGRKDCAATGRGKENVAQKEQTHHLHIELTPEQYQTLTEKAKQCGTTKRTFIIRLMEGKELRARPSKEIKALRTEVHRIGNNINQIARNVNTGTANAEDAKQSLEMLNRVYELMYEIAKK